MDEVAGREESSSSGIRLKESFLKNWRSQQDMIEARHAVKNKYRAEMREKMSDTAFVEPEKFVDNGCIEKLSDSLLRYSVVSIALFSENVMVYACSGTAVRHKHGNIRDHHRIFVTSSRLAHKFNDNRTRDDNLRIEVRTSDEKTLHGFLGLYDDTNGIAIVTSFCLKCVYAMDTCYRNPRGKLKQLFAYGCASDGTLMGANCSLPVSENEDFVSDCKITESGLGGPVLYFDPRGSGHIAGIIVDSRGDKITLLPARKLHERLESLLLITSTTSHFRRYHLPEGVKTVIPSGFMVESKILQSLGYPMPPPLLFELNGRIAGRFEEHFGQLHYWEGYPFDFSHNYGGKPIWGELGEELTQKISKSVVSVASFKDGKRCFACTGVIIELRGCPHVLTSASLVVTTVDGERMIDGNLTIDVFLPPTDSVEGKLEQLHLNYNIAIFSLKHDFSTTTYPFDISKFGQPSNNKPVVAIARATKVGHGLLMASMGEVKGKYKAVTQGDRKKKLDCKDLLLSTCQTKKVAIGGPLVGMDGSFMGMNFYDESGATPFLPIKAISAVLRQGLLLLGSDRPGAVFLDAIPGRLSSKRPRTSRVEKRNQ